MLTLPFMHSVPYEEYIEKEVVIEKIGHQSGGLRRAFYDYIITEEGEKFNIISKNGDDFSIFDENNAYHTSNNRVTIWLIPYTFIHKRRCGYEKNNLCFAFR